MKRFILYLVLLNSCSQTADQKQIIHNEEHQVINGIDEKSWSPLKNISGQKTRGTFNTYLNNESFFIRTFDINKDGIVDKVVSSVAYKGEDLLVFFGNRTGDYDKVLETKNFSEDGGNIIKDIYEIPGSKGFMVKTYFPDRGYYEKEFYIVPEKNAWILKNTVYKTMSDMSENAVKYICDVTQDINLTKSGWSEKLQPIPDEDERNKKCRTESVNSSVKQYIIQDPDGYTNLREGRGTSSPILQKINSGEKIEVINSTGGWLLIKTKKGMTGYVHKSRIQLY